ncbi:MAG: SIS domain-containing protein [Chloroflexota bacterium]|nr:SIS domain-containing protein [Chloroflexota bacterium]
MHEFDPDPMAPLAGPPEPWASSDMPLLRDRPPFHMTDMIAAEPWIAERILAAHAAPDGPAAHLAEAVRVSIDGGGGTVVTGCGTSEHAAQAAAEILGEVTGSPLIRSVQAFELSLEPPTGGLVIGISHEGATPATNAAVIAARAAGARTAMVTVSARSPGAALADIVLETLELDQSWCHTVGYVSPIAAITAVAGHLTGTPIPPSVASALLLGGSATEPAARALAIADGLMGVERWLVLASGADRPAGRELVLKVEEGAWMPAAYRDLETFLHGHLAATDVTTGLVAIATDRRGRPTRMARVRDALAAARTIGMPTAAILSAAADELVATELTSTGRIVLPDGPPEVPAAVASLLGSATALQTLTERLARVRDVDPDPIHRDVDRYRAAAEAAEG